MSDEYLCKQTCKTRGVWEDALRLLLGPFLDKSRAVVATISSNIWLSYMQLLSQLTSNFTREGTKVGRTVDGMTSIKERLVNYRAPDIFYVCIYM